MTPVESNRATAQPHITVMVPAYNEEKNIANTLHNIRGVLQQMSPYWDMVVVDDGSRDQTAQVVQSLVTDYQVTLVRFSRNFGKENAISAGLGYAKGDLVICMDADGQHASELMVTMLEKWREGYDMVYAVRQDREQESSFKLWGSRLFYRMMSASTHVDIPRDAGDFRLMNRAVVDALCALPERNRFMKGIYAWVGYKSIGIPYTPLPRLHGESAYSKLKLIALAWTGITSFSVLPLRLASLTGATLALLAFFYGTIVVIDALFFHESVPGWPTVVASMMFFAGVQLLFIGVLGEYLARVYDEVKGRPPYIVAEVIAPTTVRRQS
ncbi:glycosyltransferase family 2 protein [Methylophilus medardicus]|uniref:Glycosyltransferase family 2 protein n=1 Tax=Methylophilus medardicus TaxID=2588534 RepID=A0A5B8CU90_9PROT|nr:glycosyltransferase family 2 protein [Methylophilus medardicus]QDC44852.1 glycosyltransferase family 2 protein [Methylophilus medardicus]QDC49859.1 glycosyltransferase family 2 protein [Methylophilus medardicus]QDC53564.1 glycosyltransferase family 2 protein [Methylophilus medardicus]